MALTSGESFKIEITASDAASVQVEFAGPSHQTVSAVQGAPGWVATVTTTGWALGTYIYNVWATYADTTRSVIQRGSIEITAALANLPIGSIVSTSAQMVANIEAMLAGNATEGVRRYKINNRELERYSVGELMQLLTYWKQRLAREQRRARGESILGPRIEVRF
jgi:hypothetical protein